MEHGIPSRHEHETEAAARGRPHEDVHVLSCRAGQFDAIAADAGVDGDRLHRGLKAEHALRVGHLIHSGLFTATLDAAGKDVGFLGGGGIAEGDPSEEPVELGFGEWVGALVFDGVRGGHDVEGLVEDEGLAFDGDLAFLHRFQECGLGLGVSG